MAFRIRFCLSRETLHRRCQLALQLLCRSNSRPLTQPSRAPRSQLLSRLHSSQPPYRLHVSHRAKASVSPPCPPQHPQPQSQRYSPLYAPPLFQAFTQQAARRLRCPQTFLLSFLPLVRPSFHPRPQPLLMYQRAALLLFQLTHQHPCHLTIPHHQLQPSPMHPRSHPLPHPACSHRLGHLHSPQPLPRPRQPMSRPY